MDSRIKRADEVSHKKAIDEMREFFESEKPQLGIFWFNPVKWFLFGVSKMDADECLAQNHTTYPKLHKTYWQKQHFRALANNDTDSIYFQEHNYTMIPRGRIFYDNGNYTVKVGEWINHLDLERFSQLIQDEFNLPDNFQFEIDYLPS